MHFPGQMCQRDIEKHVPDFTILIRESMTGMHAASHTLFVVLYSHDAYKKKGENECDIFLHLSLYCSLVAKEPPYFSPFPPEKSLKPFTQLGSPFVRRIFKVLHCH